MISEGYRLRAVQMAHQGYHGAVSLSPLGATIFRVVARLTRINVAGFERLDMGHMRSLACTQSVGSRVYSDIEVRSARCGQRLVPPAESRGDFRRTTRLARCGLRPVPPAESTGDLRRKPGWRGVGNAQNRLPSREVTSGAKPGWRGVGSAQYRLPSREVTSGAKPGWRSVGSAQYRLPSREVTSSTACRVER